MGMALEQQVSISSDLGFCISMRPFVAFLEISNVRQTFGSHKDDHGHTDEDSDNVFGLPVLPQGQTAACLAAP